MAEENNAEMEHFLGAAASEEADIQAEPEQQKADVPAVTDGSSQAEPKHVPLQALDAERGKRKEMEGELAKLRERSARMEGAFQALVARTQQPQQQQEPPLPDFNEAPADHLRMRLEALQKQVQGFVGSTQQQQQQQQVYQQQQVMLQRATALEHEFRTTTPDYDTALNHLRSARHQELATFLPPEAVTRQIQSEELAVVANALQRGINPAELVYRLAQMRGYKATTQADAAAQKLDTVAKGQAASASLQTVKGKAVGGAAPQTLEEIAAIDDPAEQDKAFDALLRQSRGMAGFFH